MPGKQGDGAKAGSEATLGWGSSWLPFLYQTVGKGIEPLRYLRARGPWGMLEQSFPCSSQRSLGGHVVWFISLNCQLMNGTPPLTATRTHKEKPPGGDHRRGALILIRRKSKGKTGLTNNSSCPLCGIRARLRVPPNIRDQHVWAQLQRTDKLWLNRYRRAPMKWSWVQKLSFCCAVYLKIPSVTFGN